jgi:hypothetical protein
MVTNVLNAVKSISQSHVLKKMMKSQDVQTVMAVPLQTKEDVSFILKTLLLERLRELIVRKLSEIVL